MRLAVFLLSLLFIAGCRNQSPPALVIGHVAALSGGDTAAGKQAERGIKLALEELGAKASEKFNDRPLVVRHVDAASDLDVLEVAAARLVSVNGAIGLVGGTTKEQAARLDRARVPVLSPSGERANGMSDLLFTTALSTTAQAEALSRHLAAEEGAVALVIGSEDVDSQAGGAAFKKIWTEVAKDSGRLHEFAASTDGKMDDLAGRIAEKKPKTVVFAGTDQAWRDIRRQWKGSEARWAYIGPEGTLTGVQADKVLVATSFAVDTESTKSAEFAKKYRAKFDEEPTVHAALAYDNLRLLIEALQEGQSRAPEKLRDELLKIKDFAGITGPLSFAGQHHLRRPAFIAELRGSGLPTAVKRIMP